jgi:hypothetical protein
MPRPEHVLTTSHLHIRTPNGNLADAASRSITLLG